MKFRIRIRIRAHAHRRGAANHGRERSERDCGEDAFDRREGETDVTQSFEQRHQRDDEADQEDVKGHPALGLAQRVRGVEDEPAQTLEQGVGDHARHQR